MGGEIDPLKALFLKLDVVKWPGVGYYSPHNRRLYCLKEHQKHVRASKGNVKIRATVWELPVAFVNAVNSHRVYNKFLRAYSTRNDGESVRLRRGMALGKNRNCPRTA